MRTNRLIKTRKGISPIVAVLLILIIVVAAGIGLYTWAMGMIARERERAATKFSVDEVILGPGVAATDPEMANNITFFWRNTGDVKVSLVDFYVKNGTHTFYVKIVDQLIAGKYELDPGVNATRLMCRVPGLIRWWKGSVYTITLYTTVGTSIDVTKTA